MLLGEKVPEPPLQIPDVEPPDTVADKAVAGLFLQILKSAPAFTIGAGVKLITMLSVT